MALTVAIHELNGAGKTYTAVTSVYYGTKDMVNPLQAGQLEYHPIPVPPSGLKNSYWKNHCLDLSGTFDDHRNTRWYSADPGWPLGTGGVVIIGNRDSGDIGCPDASYQQALGVEDDSGYYLDDDTNGHAYYKDQTDPFQLWSEWTSGAPATVDSGYRTAAGKTKHVVTQVRVGPGATAARHAGGQFTFKWQQVD